MSEKDETQDADFSDETALVTEETDADATDAEPQVDTKPEQEPISPENKRPRSAVAWLAVLLAVLACLASGAIWFEDWRSADTDDGSAELVAGLQSELRATRSRLAELDGELTRLNNAGAEAVGGLDELRDSIEARLQRAESLAVRTGNLEASLAAMQGVSAGARDTWLLAEAEYYLQIANAQLQLAGNPELAAMALGMADERLLQLANPALTEVRRAVAEELAAIAAMDKPDIEGISLTLASLARVVDALPVRSVRELEGADPTAADGETSGLGRAWQSVKETFGGMVRVSRPNESAAPLLTPDAIYFLRTNLTLQLQAARLALLRGEASIYQQSLDDADNWLGTYFDTDSTQVQSAQTTIDEIRDGVFVAETPDISSSLALLRQFKTLSETAP